MEGKIKVIDFTKTFDSGFTKREFVVTTDEKFPQDIKFELIKDKCDLIDEYSEGNWIKVNFNMKGNEYNDKYYVNLQAWKLEAVEGRDTQAQAVAESDVARAEVVTEDDDGSGDLPF